MKTLREKFIELLLSKEFISNEAIKSSECHIDNHSHDCPCASFEEGAELFRQQAIEAFDKVMEEGNSLECLIKKHLEFSIVKFPNSTDKSSLLGLKKEADEAIEELHGINRDYNGEALPLEYVDCLMYLFDSIERSGLTMSEIKSAFIKKLEINEGRVWIKNFDGTYSHKTT